MKNRAEEQRMSKRWVTAIAPLLSLAASMQGQSAVDLREEVRKLRIEVLEIRVERSEERIRTLEHELETVRQQRARLEATMRDHAQEQQRWVHDPALTEFNSVERAEIESAQSTAGAVTAERLHRERLAVEQREWAVAGQCEQEKSRLHRFTESLAKLRPVP